MEINLLPWREEVLAYNRKFFTVLLIGALCLSTLFIVYFYFRFFNDVRLNQQYVESLQHAKIAITDKNKAFIEHQKTYEKSGKRLLTLIKLQYDRYETVKLLNEIIRIIPKGIYLNQIIRRESKVEITGISDSNLLITQLIKAIDASPDLIVVSLEKVEKKEGDELVFVSDFKLQLSIRSPYDFEEKPKEKEAGTISTVLKILMEKDKKLENIFLKKKN